MLGTTLLALVAAAPLTAGSAQAVENEPAATEPWDAATGAPEKTSLSPIQVEEFWTAERMESATPMPVPEATPGGDDAGEVPPSTQAESGEGFVPEAPVSGSIPGTLALDYFSTSRVWSTHGKMPAATIGKLFFTKNGSSRSCSAATINASNRNTIWTAAHCVSNGNGGWSSNFAFVPDYHDGKRPYGTWTAKSWAVPKGYHEGKNSRYDLGAIALNLSSGRRAGNVVGYQGYKFGEGHNETSFQDTRAFGYPSDTHPPRSGIDSKQLRFCVGYAAPDALFRRMACDMGKGASGGPWITDMPLSRGWGYIIGHNAWIYGASELWTYGPTLGTAAINVRAAVHTD
nr:peptidase [Actinomadura rugatobispora]